MKEHDSRLRCKCKGKIKESNNLQNIAELTEPSSRCFRAHETGISIDLSKKL
jgi:hypothetical protein